METPATRRQSISSKIAKPVAMDTTVEKRKTTGAIDTSSMEYKTVSVAMETNDDTVSVAMETSDVTNIRQTRRSSVTVSTNTTTPSTANKFALVAMETTDSDSIRHQSRRSSVTANTNSAAPSTPSKAAPVAMETNDSNIRKSRRSSIKGNTNTIAPSTVTKVASVAMETSDTNTCITRRSFNVTKATPVAMETNTRHTSARTPLNTKSIITADTNTKTCANTISTKKKVVTMATDRKRRISQGIVYTYIYSLLHYKKLHYIT